MKIIYYEMRKSWLKLVTLMVLIIFSALDVFRIYDISRTQYTFTFGKLHEPYFRLYSTVCGVLTDEKLTPFRTRAQELEDTVKTHTYSTDYDPKKYITGYCFGDFNLYNSIIGQEISYCATYSNMSNLIAAKACDNYFFYTNEGMDYEAEKALIIYNSFIERSISEYRATYWTGLFFSYDFSSLLCIIMLILGLSSCLSTENENGMLQLIISSGKMQTTIVLKIISSATYCAILSVYFTFLDLISTHFFLGVDGLNMPIYSSAFFDKSPFTFSFLSAIVLWIMLRFLALFAISLMIILLSKFSSNSVVATCISFVLSLVLIIMSAFSSSIFNPVSALIPDSYIRYFDVVSIFGKPILTLFVAIIIMVSECIVLCVTLLIGKKLEGKLCFWKK